MRPGSVRGMQSIPSSSVPTSCHVRGSSSFTSCPGWAKRAAPRLAEVVGALGHAEAFVDVEAEALAPPSENRLREMLARAHAVPERGHVGARGARLLQDLPVDGGY